MDKLLCQRILPEVKLVSAGETHTCATTVKGVRCWGSNFFKQATPVEDLAEVKLLATGQAETCVLNSDGVVCWGRSFDANPNNQLKGLVNPSQLVSGGGNTCALTDNGIKCWGLNKFFVPSGLPSVSKIALGEFHSCVIDNEKVKCWGMDYRDQISVPSDLAPALDIATGKDHNCATTVDGVRCWGPRAMAKALKVPDDIGIPKKIALGDNYSCALLTNNSVRCWGQYLNTVPEFTQEVSDIAAGEICAYAIVGNKLVCWNNSSIVFEIDSLKNPRELQAKGENACVKTDEGYQCWGQTVAAWDIPKDLKNPSLLALGEYHGCAQTDEGVRCWGDSGKGQQNIPQGLDPIQMTAGYSHTCALKAMENLYVGEENRYGQSNVPSLKLTR